MRVKTFAAAIIVTNLSAQISAASTNSTAQDAGKNKATSPDSIGFGAGTGNFEDRVKIIKALRPNSQHQITVGSKVAILSSTSNRHLRGGNGGCSKSSSFTSPYVPEDPVFPFPNWGAIQSLFPSLPGVSYVVDSPTEAGVRSMEQLKERIAESMTTMASIRNPVTLGGTTAPAIAFMYDLQQFSALGVEQHQQIEYPEQFASFAYPTPVFESLDKRLISRWASFFTDSDLAEEDFWPGLAGSIAGGSPVTNLMSALKKVPLEGRKALEGFLTDGELNLGYEYYIIDTTAMAAVPPHVSTNSRDRFSVGALIILRSEKGDKAPSGRLIPSAVVISSNKGTFQTPDVITKVFNPAVSSPSAWRLGLLAARAAVTQWGVIVGHVLPYHIVTGAVQTALFNHVQPNHPLRSFLAPFAKYTNQFNTLMLGNVVSLDAFPYENDAPGLANLMPVFPAWEEYINDTPYVDMVPSRFLAKNGIAVEDFSTICPSDSSSFTSGHSSRCGSWSAFPFAGLVEEVEHLAARFVRKAVQRLYPRDCDVAGDLQLQNMVAAMMAPEGGNLGRVTLSGKVETVAELREFLTTYMYSVLIHGTGRVSKFLPYAAPPNIITSLMDISFLSDEDGHGYSMEEMLAVMPDTHTMMNTVSFMNFFGYTTPYDPLVPRGGPMADLPYSADSGSGVLANTAATLNAAVIQLRRGIERIVKRYPKIEGTQDIFPLAPLTDVNQWPMNVES